MLRPIRKYIFNTDDLAGRKAEGRLHIVFTMTAGYFHNGSDTNSMLTASYKMIGFYMT